MCASYCGNALIDSIRHSYGDLGGYNRTWSRINTTMHLIEAVRLTADDGWDDEITAGTDVSEYATFTFDSFREFVANGYRWPDSCGFFWDPIQLYNPKSYTLKVSEVNPSNSYLICLESYPAIRFTRMPGTSGSYRMSLSMKVRGLEIIRSFALREYVREE